MVTTRSWWCLICSCVFWSSKEVHAIIQEPQNIRLNSVMLNSVLLWDPSNFSEGNVTYTIQYKSSMKSNFTDLCRRIYFTECNISNTPKYGLSNLRIRAEFENKQSHWIYLNFTPFMDTIIIPPIVQIIPTKPGVLDVYLQSPPVILSGIRYSLKDFYGSIGYKMKIWMNTSEQVNNVTTPHPFHVISGLNPGITYCLKAQVFIEEYNKTGEWSEATCTQTINSNYIIGTDSVILLVIFLTVLAFIFFCCIIYFRIKRCFYPSYSLPQHFIQFLSHPYDSSQFLDSQSQGEDHNYDTVIVLSEKSKQCNSESENKTSNIKQELQGSQEDIIRSK
ncbi:PREDICTED: interleukin-10 receptor subunit beta-like isoform X1 [Thamnophis sirtalis]|uniref:Interleukin-10 receptor subunit beta-like isoform X1 n=1 Tax=Thamnophis sirtalis TaxID=35019 RepID=A0A6I9YI41_9SAUR|nr:PREDICTED: interleukin-10 receptor subunit beta-like isoform X1 [Thamnophis sirtalis]